ncbi:OLC1v1000161C1 [Oldenlandia corymbosa var. corymbosa]|uniref:OLC1v1000161C1 n=1 Tax=Oldenlandia corymbosa var. corymbosa TaxID=529605 RepID=A0AAV1D239_OLDCO|nr:OLC1v1000161C1 [Oldenlandia corymbosa var. corymbosa]
MKEASQGLHTQLADLAYQAEHVIDLVLGDEKTVVQHSLWLFHLAKSIRRIKMQLADIDGNSACSDGVDNSPKGFIPNMSYIPSTSIDEVMVGLKDQKEEIICLLTRGSHQRDIISIVGMPGIGKTTFADNVVKSPSVMYHFPIRARCCVSQTYKKRDLLLDVLSHIITVESNTYAMSDSDLEQLLYRKLKGQRYLIIMDDMWSTKAWDDLKLSFPDDKNGSRILITSRLRDVVSRISHPYPLPALSKEESWEFLKLKLFGKEECPQELVEIGQQIAESCHGLPLAIGAIAGFLDRNCGKSKDLWKQTAESVSSTIINDPETKCKKILELSYDHLPDFLKACLLYIGAFPEDKDVPVWRLQWLWIAEGFVCEPESGDLEDVAEKYLMDLTGRSLVIVAKRGSNGKVKACRVHDLVHDLCLLKAEEERFLLPISANDKPYSSFEALDYGVLYEHFNTSNSISYEQYRLSFCVDREQFVLSRPCGPFVRSLIFSAATDMSPSCSYDVSFISSNFERLRVLDLEHINMGSSFINGIELLIDLKYLAICGDIESIPPSLSKLQNLEILLVKGLKKKVALPDTIWRMEKLRHVHVSNHAIFTLPNAEKGKSSFQLNRLVTLSLPYFSLGEKTNETIIKFLNLRRLKCVFSEPRDFSENFCWASELKSLSQLQALKISYYGKGLNSDEWNLPSGLKELTLSKFRLSRDHLSEIGRLQNLEVLKLISCAFEEPSWEMSEGEFPSLKFLELKNLNIIHWDASSDHLPQLQQLVLRNCQQLDEVPLDLVSIPTLTRIEIQSCGDSVEASVREIEEQGIEGINIVIHNSHFG